MGPFEFLRFSYILSTPNRRVYNCFVPLYVPLYIEYENWPFRQLFYSKRKKHRKIKHRIIPIIIHFLTHFDLATLIEAVL